MLTVPVVEVVEVVEVGSGVARTRVGDMVCLPFNIDCGFCRNCEDGLTGYGTVRT